MRSRELKKREKGLKADYSQAYKDWRAARKEAQSNGEECAVPKPKKPGIKVIKKRLRGKGAKEKAESLAARLQERYEAKQSQKELKEVESTEREGRKKA